MTIIAAINDKANKTIYVASDSRMTYPNGMYRHAVGGKTFSKNGIFVGYSGSPRIAQALQHHAEFDTQDDNQDDISYLIESFCGTLHVLAQEYFKSQLEDGSPFVDAAFLVVYRGHMYTVFADMTLVEATDTYTAVGSGAPYALASLFTSGNVYEEMSPLWRVQEAVEAAINFDPTCGGFIKVDCIEYE